jgi:hypothetical protein
VELEEAATKKEERELKKRQKLETAHSAPGAKKRKSAAPATK